MKNKNKLTFKLTHSEYYQMRNNDGGYCLACGEEAYGIEPDARGYVCESCDAHEVYGIEELIIMGRILIKMGDNSIKDENIIE